MGCRRWKGRSSSWSPVSYGSMKVLVVGATGFIGKTTVAFLRGKGHEVTAWVRNAEKATDMLGDGVRIESSIVSAEDL